MNDGMKDSDRGCDLALESDPQIPVSTISEREFLIGQAAHSKAAMARTLSDMGSTLRNMMDPGRLVRRHPWIAVGTAATAGFVAAVVSTSMTIVPGGTRARRTDAIGQSGRSEPAATLGHREALIATTGKFLFGMILALIQNTIAASVVTEGDTTRQSPSTN